MTKQTQIISPTRATNSQINVPLSEDGICAVKQQSLWKGLSKLNYVDEKEKQIVRTDAMVTVKKTGVLHKSLPPSPADALRDLWDLDVRVVKQALTRISDLCYSGKTKRAAENRKEIGNLGGPIAIVKTLVGHSNNVYLQGWGCVALGNLSLDDEVRGLVGEVGGIRVVVDAMQSFPGHSALQRSACCALRNLAYKCPRNQKLIADYGGISEILKAMRKNRADVVLQSHGCFALNHLATGGKDLKAAILLEGGLPAIAKASQRHVGKYVVKKAALSELSVLTKL